MDLDLLHARAHAERAARDVAERLREGFGGASVAAMKSESAADVVTIFDREADERLHGLLGSFDVTIGYEGEETGITGSRKTYWLVDPIDGTGHFIRGNPFCSTMIALIHDGAPVVSVIHDFVSGEMFSASAAQGATRNGEAIRVRDRSLAESYVCVELNFEIEGNLEIMRRLQLACTPVQLINCGWDFANTACGRIDGRLQKDAWGGTWDYAPGALLAAEAGAVVANIGTTTYDFTNLDFLAASPTAFKELTEGPNAIFPLV